jgi:hypothetical protein
MEKRSFTYSVLRYIHDPAAGEAMNIGIVVYSPDGHYLNCRFEYRYERLSNAFSDFDGEGFRRTLRAFDTDIDDLRHSLFGGMLRPSDVPSDAGSIARRFWADQGLSLRASEPRSGLSTNLEETTYDLFFRFVTSQNERTVDERRTDEEVWASYRSRLSGTLLTNLLRPRIFATENIEVRFDYAFKNERWHVLRPLSLDFARATSITRKASEFLGECVALSDNEELRGGRLYLLLGAPTNLEYTDTYQHAKRTLERYIPFGHELVEERDAERLIAQLDEIARVHADSTEQ